MRVEEKKAIRGRSKRQMLLTYAGGLSINIYFVYQSVLLNSTVLCEMSNIKHNRQPEQNATFLCLTTILVFITVYFIILGSFPDILKNVY